MLADLLPMWKRSATEGTRARLASYCAQAKTGTMPVFRHYIQQLSRSRFWLGKWAVAAGLASCLLLVGLFFVVTRNLDFYALLNYFALGLLLFVLVTLFYGIIAIHDVPYEIAKHRDPP